MNFNSIIYTDCPNFVIAKDYIEEFLKKNNKIFIENFLQILKHLKTMYTIKEGALIYENGDKATYPIELSLKNIHGGLQRAKIVKKLDYHNHSFEVRVDTQYTHQRLIFFISKDIDETIIFTFGFTKIDGCEKTDKTDEIAIKTDEIYVKVHSSNEEKLLWIGDVQNEYKF